MFEALDFIAELTQHIPPKGVQLIRRYGIYSSRIKSRWSDIPYVAERAPVGWKAQFCKAELQLSPLFRDLTRSGEYFAIWSKSAGRRFIPVRVILDGF